jgi:hypothetical protein
VKRRKAFVITFEALEDLLQLKPGIQIVAFVGGVEQQAVERKIKIVFESEYFEELPEGASPPVSDEFHDLFLYSWLD